MSDLTKADLVTEVNITAQGLRHRLKVMKYDMADDTRVTQLLDIYGAFYDKARDIAGNPRLSQAGKEHDLSELRATTRTAVSAWKTATLGGIDDHIASEAATINKPAATETDPVKALRQEFRNAAIVSQVLAIDEVLWPDVYASGNAEVRQAMETAAPRIAKSANGGLRIVPLIAPEVVADMAQRRAEAENPETAGRLQDLRLVRRTLDGLANTALAALREGSNTLDGADPVAAAAR